MERQPRQLLLFPTFETSFFAVIRLSVTEQLQGAAPRLVLIQQLYLLR
jgi:hypothetical protein